ncbi:MAG: hypothetical protein DIU54_011360 [Acidobacteriota bacterium]
MEQRTLRLGDIVDDYCPRERRITNHAIVAIVEDAIRLTRCTTCEHEHEYRHAREPRRRRKSSTAALFNEVLAGMGGTQLVPPDEASADDVPAAAAAAPAPVPATAPAPLPDATAESINGEQPAEPAVAANGETADRRVDDADLWPAHRTLIRATLPKLSNEPPPRPIPEFTMHQRSPKGRHQRNLRLLYGPQGDPFGRPLRPQDGQGRGGGQNGRGGAAQGSDKPRRRRRGGKRR